ncbi:MAG: cell division protein SepF [Streptococcaceae bacterium]|jgi:cell division inhibitor SepF|nr:cell division protein SepF [Streptococcaceae bacterium]
MGIRDQFNKLRDYFVEDDEGDDYEYEDEGYEEAAPEPQVETRAPQAPQQTAPRPVAQPQPVASARPQAVPPQQTLRTATQPTYSNRRGLGTNTQGTVRTQAPGATVLSRAATQTAVAAQTIVVKYPAAYQEVMEIANFLKSGQSVLINFHNMADQQARRSIDFLTGIAFCLEGDISNVSGQTFLVTPTGVTVEGAREMSMLAGQDLDNFELM